MPAMPLGAMMLMNPPLALALCGCVIISLPLVPPMLTIQSVVGNDPNGGKYPISTRIGLFVLGSALTYLEIKAAQWYFG